MTAKEKAGLVAAACEEHKALETAVLALRDTIVADYFVIAAGRSRVQVQALAEAVEEALDAAGVALGHREGYQAARWVLLDYGDVVVHLFAEDERRFYALERLWEEADAVGEDA